MDEFIGTIKAFGFSWAPRGWAQCNGQLLPIAQYQAVFSLLGTTYGGDGRTTFALPDLRGRVPINQGTGAGLSNRTMGAKSGTESNVLNINQMPSHAHQVNFTGQSATASVSIPAVNDGGTLEETEGNILANHAGAFAAATSADTSLSAFTSPLQGMAATTSEGGTTPVNNMPPFLAVNYCICLEGIYPSRN